MPPGKATKASERSNMILLRSCMSFTIISSEIRFSATSYSSKKSGITPVT